MSKYGLLPLLLAASVVFAQTSNISSKTAGLRKIDGFLPLYWDDHAGKMWLEIDRLNQEFLYLTALSAGVGSNDLGLDRGLTSEPRVVSFERSGPRVLLVESNYMFRASSPHAAERRAEADSFARSTLWGFTIAAEDGDRLLLDATDFLLRDVADVGKTLQHEKQGVYKQDPNRSAFYLPLTKGFPRNTEVEATITLTGEAEGEYIRSVTPTPEAVTVREHQSFVALPEPGYQPRLQDPRAGYSSIDFMDFSAPVDQSPNKRYIMRHRLEKDKPLIYYVDPGTPEPVRSALIEGASWWNQAFEAAGFPNEFQVKVLPEDADPMDVRYNVIQWVHRSTRGWSYGNSLVDPRTGEIIKGIVTLGSLRMHQDYLIFEGLLAPYTSPDASTKPLTDAVYARLRQLAAHEVGHTLGLEHNFISSTHGRASVMDYPGPRVELNDAGVPDLSNAYATGIGDWDKVSIAWGYSEFPQGGEHAALDKILMDAAHRGLIFITDQDSRPFGSAHPKSHLWDNGPNAIDELNRLMKVRAAALARFGENNIRVGAPMSTLDDVLAPLYFLHRYQTQAAAKSLGGEDYTYALRGDGQIVTNPVPAAEQRRALQALLQTITPEALTIPDRILKLIPPHPPAYPRTRETFPSYTGLTFDPLAGPEAAANLTVGLILNSERVARLINSQPSLAEVIDTLTAPTFHAKGPVAETVKNVVFDHLLMLASDASAPQQVRSIALIKLRALKPQLDAYGVDLLNEFERDPKTVAIPRPAEAPPGQPIGEDY